MPELVPLTEEELIDLLIEESAEVILAARKCQRFGFERSFPGYGHNGTRLAEEMGDVHAMLHAILDRHPELKGIENSKRMGKLLKATLVKNGVMPDESNVVK